MVEFGFDEARHNRFEYRFWHGFHDEVAFGRDIGLESNFIQHLLGIFFGDRKQGTHFYFLHQSRNIVRVNHHHPIYPPTHKFIE